MYNTNSWGETPPDIRHTRLAVDFHEAGHCVGMLAIYGSSGVADDLPDGDSVGSCCWGISSRGDLDDELGHLMISQAGDAALEIFSARSRAGSLSESLLELWIRALEEGPHRCMENAPKGNAPNDSTKSAALAKAVALEGTLAGSAEPRIIEIAQTRAWLMLADNWLAVEAIAALMWHQRIVLADEAKTLFDLVPKNDQFRANWMPYKRPVRTPQPIVSRSRDRRSGRQDPRQIIADYFSGDVPASVESFVKTFGVSELVAAITRALAGGPSMVRAIDL
jgi:hypothetical protein